MRTHTTTDDTDAAPLSWRISAWLKAAGHPFSRVTLYNEIHRGNIDARKIGSNTIILTPPRDYLMRLPKRLGPPIGRGRKRVQS
jgi:hypothetical protein